MASNIRVIWTLPTTRQGGGLLPPDEIKHTQVDLSADGGANWTPLVSVLPAQVQEASVPDAEIGDWHFRIRCVDLDDQVGAPVIHIVSVVDTSPPGPVTDVQHFIE